MRFFQALIYLCFLVLRVPLAEASIDCLPPKGSVGQSRTAAIFIPRQLYNQLGSLKPNPVDTYRDDIRNVNGDPTYLCVVDAEDLSIEKIRGKISSLVPSGVRTVTLIGKIPKKELQNRGRKFDSWEDYQTVPDEHGKPQPISIGAIDFDVKSPVSASEKEKEYIDAMADYFKRLHDFKTQAKDRTLPGGSCVYLAGYDRLLETFPAGILGYTQDVMKICANAVGMDLKTNDFNVLEDPSLCSGEPFQNTLDLFQSEAAVCILCMHGLANASGCIQMQHLDGGAIVNFSSACSIGQEFARAAIFRHRRHNREEKSEFVEPKRLVFIANNDFTKVHIGSKSGMNLAHSVLMLGLPMKVSVLQELVSREKGWMLFGDPHLTLVKYDHCNDSTGLINILRSGLACGEYQGLEAKEFLGTLADLLGDGRLLPTELGLSESDLDELLDVISTLDFDATRFLQGLGQGEIPQGEVSLPPITPESVFDRPTAYLGQSSTWEEAETILLDAVSDPKTPKPKLRKAVLALGLKSENPSTLAKLLDLPSDMERFAFTAVGSNASKSRLRLLLEMDLPRPRRSPIKDPIELMELSSAVPYFTTLIAERPLEERKRYLSETHPYSVRFAGAIAVLKEDPNHSVAADTMIEAWAERQIGYSTRKDPELRVQIRSLRSKHFFKKVLERMKTEERSYKKVSLAELLTLSIDAAGQSEVREAISVLRGINSVNYFNRKKLDSIINEFERAVYNYHL